MSESDTSSNPAAEAVPNSKPAAEATPAMALLAGAPIQQGVPTPGLSQSIGLRELPGSQVPGLPGGAMVSHVFGPGQTPCDPVAAGLDLGFSPLTAAENRVVTRTGAFAAGPRPSTYGLASGEPVPAAGPHDFVNVAAPSDAEAMNSPGPNSAIAGDEAGRTGDSPKAIPPEAPGTAGDELGSRHPSAEIVTAPAA